MTQNEYKIIHGSFVQLGEDIILDLSKVQFFTFGTYGYNDKWCITYVFNENIKYSIGSFNTRKAAKLFMESMLKDVFSYNKRPPTETYTCISKVSNKQLLDD